MSEMDVMWLISMFRFRKDAPDINLPCQLKEYEQCENENR